MQQKLKELDPEGCPMPRQKVLRRRHYTSPGPNHTWHVDGYDELKPYGFPIHSVINGWSRKIMWKVARPNNLPEIPATFYLQSVSENGDAELKCAQTVAQKMESLQLCSASEQMMKQHIGLVNQLLTSALKAGRRFFRKKLLYMVDQLFQDLIESKVLSLGNELQSCCCNSERP